MIEVRNEQVNAVSWKPVCTYSTNIKGSCAVANKNREICRCLQQHNSIGIVMGYGLDGQCSIPGSDKRC
jgi:hypothetical protein